MVRLLEVETGTGLVGGAKGQGVRCRECGRRAETEGPRRGTTLLASPNPFPTSTRMMRSVALAAVAAAGTAMAQEYKTFGTGLSQGT
jgi:hypothetical protein